MANANRLNAPNQFETLSPPWLLASLDANATQNQAAWNDSSLGFVNGVATDTGLANAYVITAANLPYGAPSAYNPGMTVSFIPANSNTASSTIQIGLLGTLSIVNAKGGALTGGELPVGFTVTLVCTGTTFVIAGMQYIPLAFTFNSSVNQNVACDGASSVVVLYTATANLGTINISLQRLRGGVPVTIFLNFAAFTGTIGIVGTNPAGGAYGTVLVVQGAAGFQTGVVQSIATGWIGSGMANAASGGLLMQFQHV
jgi:hypothetical protein